MIDIIKKDAKFVWSDACEMGFNHVTALLLSPAVMAHPKSYGLFILDTTVSDTSIASVLSQVQDGGGKGHH